MSYRPAVWISAVIVVASTLIAGAPTPAAVPGATAPAPTADQVGGADEGAEHAPPQASFRDGAHLGRIAAKLDFEVAARSLRLSFNSWVLPGTSSSIIPGTYELVSSSDITESTNPEDVTVRTRGRMVISRRATGEYSFFSAWIVKRSGVIGEFGELVFSDGSWCQRWRESCIQGLDMRVTGDSVFQYARGVNFAQVSVWRRADTPPRSPRLDKEISRQQQRARELAD